MASRPCLQPASIPLWTMPSRSATVRISFRRSSFRSGAQWMRSRRIIRAHVDVPLSYKEIAPIVGITESNVGGKISGDSGVRRPPATMNRAVSPPTTLAELPRSRGCQVGPPVSHDDHW